MNKIDEFKKRMKQLIEMKKTARENKSHLDTGSYYFTHGVKLMLHDKKIETLNFIDKTRYKSNMYGYILDIIRKIYFSFFQVTRDESGKFKGNLLMILNNADNIYDIDLKIFNFETRRVKTIIHNRERFLELRNNYEKFTPYFNTPYLKSNDEKQIILEKKINFKPARNWKLGDTQKFIENYTNSLKYYMEDEISKNNLYLTTKKLHHKLITKVKNRQIIDSIEKSIPKSKYQDKWPVIQMHGDLKMDNILLQNGTYYLIDWEYSANTIFIYDIMDFICKEKLYLEAYLEGEYDKYIATIFDETLLQYEPKNREYYLAIYIMQSLVSKDSLEDEIIQEHLNILSDIHASK